MNPITKMSSFIAVEDDGESVLGKILYFSLSSILVETDKLAQICADINFPTAAGKRVALADAFRSATGDIYESRTVKTPYGTETYKVYCRDNATSQSAVSRELVKETLGITTNEYKKLANITFSKDYGVSYDSLVHDDHVDAAQHCREAIELYELYQDCVGRKQIETLLRSFVDSLSAVKLLAHGHMYFIPREHMHRLEVFEDLIEQLEANNKHRNPRRMPMDSNSMYVVNDAKQREKMAAAFYRSVRRDIAEYQERADYLIKSGSESAAVMERWVVKIANLEDKKREYESILKRELNDIDDEFSTLGYLSQELQIRARGIRLRNAA